MKIFCLNSLKNSLLTSLLLISLAACVSRNEVKSDVFKQDSPHGNVASKVINQAYWLDQPKVIPWQVNNDSESPETKQNQQLFDWMVGELTAYRGDIQTGLVQLTETALELDQADAYRRVANVAFFAKDNKTAYSMVNRWLLLEPENEQAHHMALSLEIDRLNLSLPDAKAKAYQHIDWLLEHSKASLAQRFLDLTTQLRQQKNQAMALDLMEGVIDKYPNNADAYTAYANLAIIFNRQEIATTALEQALKLNPKQSNAIILQSQMQFQQGEKQAALAKLKRAVKKDKKNRQLRSTYARMLMNAKQYNKAGYQYEYLLEDTPNDDSLLFTLGLLALDSKDYELGRKYFNRLQLASSRQDEANFYLGRIAEIEEKYKEAASYYLSVYAGNYYIESRFRAAWSYAKLSQFDVAQKLLQNQRQQKDPAIALRSYVAEGQLLRQQKRYQAAFDLYTQAIQQTPHNNELLYARSLVADKLNNIEIVEQDLRDILKREPDNADVLNTLGYALLNLTDRYDEALLLIKRALQMEPESGPIIDSYGWALYRKGEYQAALKYLRKAYEITPDPEIAAHLGEVLWVLGDKQRAEQVWNTALEAEPNSDVVLKTIDRLKKQ